VRKKQNTRKKKHSKNRGKFDEKKLRYREENREAMRQTHK
jgi:hypothetical protein